MSATVVISDSSKTTPTAHSIIGQLCKDDYLGLLLEPDPKIQFALKSIDVWGAFLRRVTQLRLKRESGSPDLKHQLASIKNVGAMITACVKHHTHPDDSCSSAYGTTTNGQSHYMIPASRDDAMLFAVMLKWMVKNITPFVVEEVKTSEKYQIVKNIDEQFAANKYLDSDWSIPEFVSTCVLDVLPGGRLVENNIRRFAINVWAYRVRAIILIVLCVLTIAGPHISSFDKYDIIYGLILVELIATAVRHILYCHIEGNKNIQLLAEPRQRDYVLFITASSTMLAMGRIFPPSSPINTDMVNHRRDGYHCRCQSIFE